MTTLKLIVGPVQKEWMERAACAGANPDPFFPGKNDGAREAKAICAGCTVRETCLEHAISEGEEIGIWGGLTAGERRRLISARARGVA